MFKTRIISTFVALFCIGLCANPNVIELSSAQHNHLDVPLMHKMKNCFGVDTLIETGSFVGATALMGAPIFNEVHTIELSDILFLRTCTNVESHSNVHCYFGDSSEELSDIIDQANGRLLFWLDAHYSGGETAKAECNDPVNYEYTQILQSGRRDSVILLDDIRGHNLPYIAKLIKSIDANFKCYVLGDVLLSFSSAYYNPEVSPLVEACTLFRLSTDQVEMETAERLIISLGLTQESAHLTELSKQFGDDKNLGVYRYLEGLANLGRKDYHSATKCFKTVKLCKYEKHFQRLDYYLELAQQEGRDAV